MNNNNNNDKNRYNVLFICTSSTPGLWLHELSTPFYIFQDVGYNCDIASISNSIVFINLITITDGASARLSTAPKLSAKINNLRFFKNPPAVSKFPFIKKVIIAPNPFCCFLAISCCGCDFNPG